MLTTQQYYERLSQSQTHREVILQRGVKTTVAFFVQEAELELLVTAQEDQAQGEVFVFFPAQVSQQSALKVDARIGASEVQLSLHFIALQAQDSHISLS